MKKYIKRIKSPQVVRLEAQKRQVGKINLAFQKHSASVIKILSINVFNRAKVMFELGMASIFISQILSTILFAINVLSHLAIGPIFTGISNYIIPFLYIIITTFACIGCVFILNSSMGCLKYIFIFIRWIYNYMFYKIIDIFGLNSFVNKISIILVVSYIKLLPIKNNIKYVIFIYLALVLLSPLILMFVNYYLTENTLSTSSHIENNPNFNHDPEDHVYCNSMFDDDELEYDGLEYICISDYKPKYENVFVKYFGHGGNKIVHPMQLKPFIVHTCVLDNLTIGRIFKSVPNNLPSHIDFSNHMSPLEKNCILNYFSNQRLYIQPSIELQLEAEDIHIKSEGIPFFYNMDPDIPIETLPSYSDLLAITEDYNDRCKWGLMKKNALDFFENNSVRKVAVSSNSYLGLGHWSHNKSFSSYWNLQHIKTQHMLFSLDNDSWKGYPIDYTKDSEIFSTILVDYYSNTIDVDYFKAILDSNIKDSKIMSLGHVNILSNKYNIYDISIFSPFNREYCQTINLSKNNIGALRRSWFDKLCDADIMSLDNLKNSTSPNLKGYILALRQQYDRLN